MRKLNRFLFIPYVLWMILFIIVPVLLLVYFSLFDIQGHFSFENYKQMFSWKYFSMIWDSVIFAAVITIITLFISYPAAYFIRNSKYQNLWFNILEIIFIQNMVNLFNLLFYQVKLIQKLHTLNHFKTSLS